LYSNNNSNLSPKTTKETCFKELILFQSIGLLEGICREVVDRASANQHVLDGLPDVKGELKGNQGHDANIKNWNVALELIHTNFCERVEDEGHRVRPGGQFSGIGGTQLGVIVNKVL